MILKAGAETGDQSIFELVDAAIPPQHLDPIKPTILQVDGVKFRQKKLRNSSNVTVST
ncbi:Metal tolerance protein C1, variant 2 [Stylosanthes scabra]|uniref:Metal tolerance protein C1 n=1 Tax=Stylosanthes scabra TaxID=79078 RepID=A0ABU6R339_9FABA|nr:Metal tolerance protein C1 [Stylosanthes scabra]MED6118302.1 Metal tolerance protein C1, variant 2 [Stylosanthes scabra]